MQHMFPFELSVLAHQCSRRQRPLGDKRKLPPRLLDFRLRASRGYWDILARISWPECHSIEAEENLG